MNITILNGSPRKNGNTEIMAGEFVRGAKGSIQELADLKKAYELGKTL